MPLLEHVHQRLNVAAWQERFSRFIQETTYRPHYHRLRSAAPPREPQPASTLQEWIPKEVLITQWQAFVESLGKNGKSFLVSHLQMCNMQAVQDGKVLLKCGKVFSFESLQTEIAELHAEAVKFFGGLLAIDLVLDKDSVAKALKAEPSPIELFTRLSQTSPVIQYLIEHFGAEPLY